MATNAPPIPAVPLFAKDIALYTAMHFTLSKMQLTKFVIVHTKNLAYSFFKKVYQAKY